MRAIKNVAGGGLAGRGGAGGRGSDGQAACSRLWRAIAEAGGAQSGAPARRAGRDGESAALPPLISAQAAARRLGPYAPAGSPGGEGLSRRAAIAPQRTPYGAQAATRMTPARARPRTIRAIIFARMRSLSTPSGNEPERHARLYRAPHACRLGGREGRGFERGKISWMVARRMEDKPASRAQPACQVPHRGRARRQPLHACCAPLPVPTRKAPEPSAG